MYLIFFGQSVALVNVVYYDAIIWEAKFTWNNETKELKEETVEKLFPAASLTKVITVSTTGVKKRRTIQILISYCLLYRVYKRN